MQRQDSGYESYNSTPRTSTSHSRPSTNRRISNVSNYASAAASSSSASLSHPRSRPTTRRSSKFSSVHSSPPVCFAHSSPQGPTAQSISYFQFPSPEPIEACQSAGLAPELPQTTHYWTSDSRRRLEYAAIDAASRGFKGWMRRNLVPDCLVPSEDRHVAFDDDSGSVRRYRLELEDEHQGTHQGCGASRGDSRRRRKGWQFWDSRK